MSTATKAKRPVRQPRAGLRAVSKKSAQTLVPPGKVSFRDSPLLGMWKDRDFDVQKFVRDLRDERHKRLFGDDPLRQ